MKALENCSIRLKVIAAFGIVLLVTSALGVLALQRLAAVNAAAAEIRDNWLPSTGYLGNLAAETERYRTAEATILLASDADKQKVVKRLSDVTETRAKAWALYEPTITPGEERAIEDWARIKRAFD